MYNLVIVVMMVMVLFFLSHDKKFGKLFTKNTSLQIITGIILAYFSLNQINFGILLVVTVLMVLRYSYFNNNVLAPLKDKYKTPLIKDIHRMIEKFGDEDDEPREPQPPQQQQQQQLNIQAENDELQMVFEDLDRKMNSMISI